MTYNNAQMEIQSELKKIIVGAEDELRDLSDSKQNALDQYRQMR